MSEAKFTPGPWSYEVHELSSGLSAIVYGRNGMRIATDHLSEADARLISAAPDLYAALADALETIKALHGPRAWDIYWNNAPEMKRYRAALAKARGETP